MAQSAVEYSKRAAINLTEKAPIQVLHVDVEAGFLKAAAKRCLEMQGTFISSFSSRGTFLTNIFQWWNV